MIDNSQLCLEQSKPQKMLRIIVDAKEQLIPLGSTLEQVVDFLGEPQNSVATAVNQQFVPRSQRAQRSLNEGDCVLLFQPIVGG